jgi:NAD(P)-dependent dehydrogenase (short-subunit alcohol dehydrogenase family)
MVGDRMALPNYTAYAASKAGVDAVTRSAAIALAPRLRDTGSMPSRSFDEASAPSLRGA